MIITKSANGVEMRQPETAEERKKCRKPGPITHAHAMSGVKFARYTSVSGSFSRNRKKTRGRNYEFQPVYKMIGMPGHAIAPKKVFTGSFRKVEIPKF